MSTTRETVRLLCKSIINRLENQKAISFPPRLRQVIQDEIFGLVGPSILSEQDLRERTLARMGAKADLLQDTQFTESEQYKAARAVIRGTFGDDILNGLFFQKPLKIIAHTLAEYFMRSSHIDDVYETDEDIEQHIVEVIQKFDESQAH
ncbi:MAG TPA: hypothetical protein DCS07_08640 [Bdellovibrionales bacterium]|nr:MAG: hypothetical protein A2Z97_03030 [Bdellovibrionales bacterium GWB1_52_6]OFZ03436.1 MAG: hypothetical protein A2X97_05675 [Bdellovibrionales bacterium GWA1_52_35]OFZ41607.1 MAG: hypothetical protein A2070_04225 [Bdellovibrionales bacterium GWC1_52_8]HAR42677.1 hypothetical protein [Bdellovibrionales bacterium]HCM41017.1 hypothetical protein [Bdellovibrionales bacterium]